ncbi:hypothetical protein B0H19DRAFT_1346182 [Mycena capillaripes]|nr:hypothetical protein B0H19DRAFT_1346182 [Mycena capillaripes]
MPIYTLPHADRSLSLLKIVEFHATTNPDHPLFRYQSASAPEGYEDVTWCQARKMFHTTAQIIRHRLGGEGAVDCTSPPAVGILAATSGILYASLIFGVLRAGCTVFPLSPRNSDAGIAQNLEIARKAKSILHSRNISINLVPTPTYEEICVDEHTDLGALPPLQPIDDDCVLIITHSSGNRSPIYWSCFRRSRSSGSTSFPKVIPFAHKYLIEFGRPCLADLSTRVQAMGSAMFHSMGFLWVIRSMYSGVIISLLPPTTNVVIPTPEHMLASALETKSTTIMCPPMFLEHWVQDPSSIEKLRTFSRVFFGGGPLAQPVGDILDGKGVLLMIVYGLTEFGVISQLIPEAPHTHGWQYFQFTPSLDPVLVPVDDDANGSLFQLILKQCATSRLALPNIEVDGVLALDTKDIVQRHPTVPTLYRVYGRLDNQIMHSNGEKTNPGPIEQILAQNPLVKAAIMFGRERAHAGVIITPSEKVLDLDSFRDAIWATVERANTSAPGHSRLFKDMIVLAVPSRPFQLTAKGTPRRQKILDDYAPDIDAAYAAFHHAVTPACLQAHKEISMNDALEIVREHVRTNIGPGISDYDNLFDAGTDSLLAARIRRGIMQALAGRIPETVIPNDLVFTSSTIAQLASFVHTVSVGASAVAYKPYTNMPASILDHRDETIVRLRDPAAGELPLILVHGGGGFIFEFAYMQTHFRSGLWAIQVVAETLRISFVAQTDFYYMKIKYHTQEAQPAGPYRIGGYSAGAFMACRIAKLLEAGRDNVIQLALLDHSPLLALAPHTGDAYIEETDFAEEETLRAHYERGVWELCTTLRGDKHPWWRKFAECAWERWKGRMRAEDMSEMMTAQYENLFEGSVRAFEFMLSLAGEHRASRGVILGVVPQAQSELWALGLDWCCADVRVVEMEADHFDILKRNDLLEDLEKVVA